MKFLCVASSRDDKVWQALCLDLDLAVQGCSLDEAKERLREAVSEYVRSADEEPEPLRSQLLARKAPLSVRLAWGARILLSRALAISGRSRVRNDAVRFPVECPA